MLIPFALPLGIILGGTAIWPFFERWLTGDKAAHHINDRPRTVPTRTGIGVAVVAADANGVPSRAGAGTIAKPRVGMNAVYTESAAVVLEANGHSADGHSADGAPNPTDGHAELPAGQPRGKATADPNRPS